MGGAQGGGGGGGNALPSAPASSRNSPSPVPTPPIVSSNSNGHISSSASAVADSKRPVVSAVAGSKGQGQIQGREITAAKKVPSSSSSSSLNVGVVGGRKLGDRGPAVVAEQKSQVGIYNTHT